MLSGLRRRVLRSAMATYQRRKRRHCDTSVGHCLDVAAALIRDSKYGFLITRGDDGWSSARLVEPIIEPRSLVAWIGTNPRLRKVQEVRRDPRVTLAFGSTRERANLVLYGDARIESDPALRKRYWRGTWRMFFPGGPASSDFVLLRIKPVRLELMSFRRNVVPEPFGLRPVALVCDEGVWRPGDGGC